MHLFPFGKKLQQNLCLLAAVMTLTVACAPSNEQKKDERSLITAVEAFNRTFRWEDYRAASAWIQPTDKESFWKMADLMHGYLRVMEFQVREVSTSADSTSGTVALSFRFYFTNDPNLLTKTITQKWRWSEEEKSWLVVRHGLEVLLETR